MLMTDSLAPAPPVGVPAGNGGEYMAEKMAGLKSARGQGPTVPFMGMHPVT